MNSIRVTLRDTWRPIEMAPSGEMETQRPSTSPARMTESDDEDEPTVEGQGNGEQSVHQEDEEEEVDPGAPAEEDSDSDDSEEDDEEPSLKYQRITGAIPDLLKKDSASALAISNKVMVHFWCLHAFLIIDYALVTGNGHTCWHHPYIGFNRKTNKIVQATYGIDS